MEGAPTCAWSGASAVGTSRLPDGQVAASRCRRVSSQDAGGGFCPSRGCRSVADTLGRAAGRGGGWTTTTCRGRQGRWSGIVRSRGVGRRGHGRRRCRTTPRAASRRRGDDGVEARCFRGGRPGLELVDCLAAAAMLHLSVGSARRDVLTCGSGDIGPSKRFLAEAEALGQV